MRVKVAFRGSDGVVEHAVEAAGGTLLESDDEGAADLLVTVGERALLSLAERGVDAPVLPVDAGAGRFSIPTASVTDALDAVAADRHWTERHPVLSVAVDGDVLGRAVTDVTLVRSDPAKISGYAVRTDEETLSRFRSDGVVAATPLGSTGYARAAGGPLLAPETGVAVVPVGPFSTRSDAWVLDPPFSLTVEREEGAVTVLADDRAVRQIGPATSVRIRGGDTLRVVRVAGGDGGPERKNSNE
jgi:NAD+ kinase